MHKIHNFGSERGFSYVVYVFLKLITNTHLPFHPPLTLSLRPTKIRSDWHSGIAGIAGIAGFATENIARRRQAPENVNMLYSMHLE